MSAASTSSAQPPEATRGSLIPALPDDLAIHCIALLPRAAHPSLALVSRAFHALLRRNPEPLLAARRNIRVSDPHILISLRPPASESPLFFLLLPHPGWPPLPLPSPPIPVSSSSSAAAAGSRLFLVGGSVAGVPTPSVQILDPRARSWSIGPRLSSPREFAAAVALSGVLLVAGGCVPSSPFWAEALDLSSSSPDARWGPVPSPAHFREKWMHGCASLAGKVLAVADRGGLAYDPAAPPGEAWAPVSPDLDMGWKGRAAVVGGILYSYDYLGQVKGYDPGTDAWSKVEGLEHELPRFLCGATLANAGGLLYLVWEGKWRGEAKGKGEARSMVVIDWAAIEVKSGEEGRIMGKVVSKDTTVFTDLPKGSTITHCTALEL